MSKKVLDTLDEGWVPDLVILEGMFLINSASIRTHHVTFQDYLAYIAKRWVVPHLRRGTRAVHVVFDDPGALGKPSLKDLERSRRDALSNQKSTEPCEVTISAPLPTAWRPFLNERHNKSSLVALLCNNLPQILQSELRPGQYILTSGGFDGLERGKSLILEHGKIPEFSSTRYYGLHEESDTLMWSHAVQSPASRVLIFSPDTDVYLASP